MRQLVVLFVILQASVSRQQSTVIHWDESHCEIDHLQQQQLFDHGKELQEIRRNLASVVRQLSEIGVYQWIPFQASRSVVRLNAKRLDLRIERWEKIAVEAAKQCGRNRLMSIEPVASFSQVLDRYTEFDQGLIFWHPSKHAK